MDSNVSGVVYARVILSPSLATRFHNGIFFQPPSEQDDTPEGS